MRARTILGLPLFALGIASCAQVFGVKEGDFDATIQGAGGTSGAGGAAVGGNAGVGGTGVSGKGGVSGATSGSGGTSAGTAGTGGVGGSGGVGGLGGTGGTAGGSCANPAALSCPACEQCEEGDQCKSQYDACLTLGHCAAAVGCILGCADLAQTCVLNCEANIPGLSTDMAALSAVQAWVDCAGCGVCKAKCGGPGTICSKGMGGSGGTAGGGGSGQGGAPGCPHDTCTVGPSLAPGCSQCVSDICAQTPACCAIGGSWTPNCVAAGMTFPSCNTFKCAGQPCMVDTECSGPACGGAVCSPSSHMCVPAGMAPAGGDGSCKGPADCKCPGAVCNAGHCSTTTTFGCQTNGPTCGNCAECAKVGACHSQWQACVGNPDCQTLAACYAGCNPTDKTCVDNCTTFHPSGVGMFGQFRDCAYCGECSGVCTNSAFCGAGGAGGSGTGGAGGGPGCPVTQCTTGLKCCGGTSCVDVATDPHNCGICGNDCGTGTCASSACTGGCLPPPKVNPTNECAAADAGGDCSACAACASTSSVCASAFGACSGSCQGIATCIGGCASTVDPVCQYGCENGSPAACEYENARACVSAMCPLSCAPHIATCPANVVVGGNTVPSACVRLAHLVPDAAVPHLDLCYEYGGTVVGPVFAPLNSNQPLRYGQVTQLLPLPANGQIQVWTTRDKCDPGDPSKYSAGFVTTFAPGDMMGLAQVGLISPPNGGDQPNLVFRALQPKQAGNVAVRWLSGVIGSPTGLNVVTLTATELGTVGSAKFGEFLVKASTLVGVNQDAKGYFGLMPETYHATLSGPPSGQSIWTGANPLPAGSAASSGTFTVYLMGAVSDPTFGVRALVCDDDQDIGHFGACKAY